MLPSVGTRAAEPATDFEFVNIARAQFETDCRNGSIVMPFFFAGNWYGYRQADWREARKAGGRSFVFNVRPYTGLLLAASLSYVIPVWLDLPTEVRQQRLATRRAVRDSGFIERAALDDQEGVYKALYPNVIDTTDTEAAFANLMVLLSSNGNDL